MYVWLFDLREWIYDQFSVQKRPRFSFSVGKCNLCQVAEFLFFICFLNAFLEWTESVKYTISQHAPDVCLQDELCYKCFAREDSRLPISLLTLEQFIHQKPHCIAPQCKTPSISFFFSHTFGPGPSHGTPLAVLVEVGLPYWKLVFYLNPSWISKEDTWALSQVS